MHTSRLSGAVGLAVTSGERLEEESNLLALNPLPGKQRAGLAGVHERAFLTQHRSQKPAHLTWHHFAPCGSLRIPKSSDLIDKCKTPLRRGHLLVVVLASMLLVSGCHDQPQRRTTPDPTPPAVGLSFIQQRIDEGTTRGNLRVINEENKPLVVTRIGLDWPGYGRFVRDFETTIAPRQTIDLRIDMPKPLCDAATPRAFGIVDFSGSVLRARIDGSGQGYLQRMWRRACDMTAVSQAVSFHYSGPWRSVTAFGYHHVLHGRFELRRRSGNEPVTLVRLTGSVLFDLHLDRRIVLGPHAAAGSSSLVFVPGRCDAHGLSQSQQTFVFRAAVRIGSGRLMNVYAEPDRHTQNRANAMLDRACT